jgi:hypothetical protein
MAKAGVDSRAAVLTAPGGSARSPPTVASTGSVHPPRASAPSSRFIARRFEEAYASAIGDRAWQVPRADEGLPSRWAGWRASPHSERQPPSDGAGVQPRGSRRNRRDEARAIADKLERRAGVGYVPKLALILGPHCAEPRISTGCRAARRMVRTRVDRDARRRSDLRLDVVIRADALVRRGSRGELIGRTELTPISPWSLTKRCIAVATSPPPACCY